MGGVGAAGTARQARPYGKGSRHAGPAARMVACRRAEGERGSPHGTHAHRGDTVQVAPGRPAASSTHAQPMMRQPINAAAHRALRSFSPAVTSTRPLLSAVTWAVRICRGEQESSAQAVGSTRAGGSQQGHVAGAAAGLLVVCARHAALPASLRLPPALASLPCHMKAWSCGCPPTSSRRHGIISTAAASAGPGVRHALTGLAAPCTARAVLRPTPNLQPVTLLHTHWVPTSDLCLPHRRRVGVHKVAGQRQAKLLGTARLGQLLGHMIHAILLREGMRHKQKRSHLMAATLTMPAGGAAASARGARLRRPHTSGQEEPGCAAGCNGLPQAAPRPRLRVGGGHAGVAVGEECVGHVALQHGAHVKLHKVVDCRHSTAEQRRCSSWWAGGTGRDARDAPRGDHAHTRCGGNAGAWAACGCRPLTVADAPDAAEAHAALAMLVGGQLGHGCQACGLHGSGGGGGGSGGGVASGALPASQRYLHGPEHVQVTGRAPGA